MQSLSCVEDSKVRFTVIFLIFFRMFDIINNFLIFVLWNFLLKNSERSLGLLKVSKTEIRFLFNIPTPSEYSVQP